ncbi:MAG TPA: adenylate/guanylate cyclase domain-containing protein [Bacteroidota bacterium]|nr:adenylate/guanylate cyclase domain-containing protein [Bacteroidota bacterium]
MITSKARRAVNAGLLILASFLLARFLFWVFPTVFESWDHQTVDRLFVLRAKVNPPSCDSAILHVDIANSSIRTLGYYFPRRYYGDAINVLTRMRCSAIGFDIIFAQRVQALDDSVLIGAARSSGRSYFPVAFSLVDTVSGKLPDAPEVARYLDSTAWRLEARNVDGFYRAGETLLTWHELAGVAKGVGFISVEADPDGVFRRVPLLVRYRDMFYPSMTMRMACDLLRVPPERISVIGGRSITLRGADFGKGIQRDIVIPIDSKGNMIINWIGDWSAMRHLSFAQVLSIADDQDEVEAFADQYGGSIALVGDVSTGVSDVGPMPFEESLPLVGLHSSTLNTILTGSFLSEMPAGTMFLVELLVAALFVLLATQLRSMKFAAAVIVLIVGYVIAASAAFVYANLILTIVRPVLSGALSLMAVLVYWYVSEEREKQKLRSKFEQYFPPAVVKQMVDNPDALSTTPKKREITIMFSDIKSFTTYSSTMTPEEISTTLNEYFGAMTEIVFRYGGTVDKFIGDGLMVFYGAPEPQPDHAIRCVRAAIEMQKKCREFKARWEPMGRLPLKIRIGINTGEVVVGDLGSPRRMEYTVLGSDVNLAQRLESNAPVEGIMISGSTYRHVKDLVPIRPLDPIKVKGLDTPITVYEVLVDDQK